MRTFFDHVAPPFRDRHRRHGSQVIGTREHMKESGERTGDGNQHWTVQGGTS